MKHKVSSGERAILISLALIIIGYFLESEKFLFFAMLVSSAFLVGWLWQKYALSGLEYKRTFSETRAFVGETIDVTLTVTNRKILPMPRLRIDDYVSNELVFTDAEPETSHIPGLSYIRQYFALSWFERTGRVYHLNCKERGLYHFAQLRIITGDPFGLFPIQLERLQEDRLIIYPTVKPVTGLELLMKELVGNTIAERRMFEDPNFMRGVRPHQPEDDLRYIHWKATARAQTLQTKIFEPTTAPNVMLFINIATFAKHWEGIDPILLERVVSVAASICAYVVENKLMVGLSANGMVYRSDQPLRVMPSRNPQQLTLLLEALAGIRGVATGHFEDFLNQNTSRLPWRSTIIIISAVITPELEAVMMRLRDAGRKLVLLSLADAPPRRMPGVLTYHLPGREMETSYAFQ